MFFSYWAICHITWLGFGNVNRAKVIIRGMSYPGWQCYLWNQLIIASKKQSVSLCWFDCKRFILKSPKRTSFSPLVLIWLKCLWGSFAIHLCSCDLGQQYIRPKIKTPFLRFICRTRLSNIQFGVFRYIISFKLCCIIVGYSWPKATYLILVVNLKKKVL